MSNLFVTTCSKCGCVFADNGTKICLICEDRQIKVKLLNKSAKLPTKGSEYAVGYDLYASESIMVRQGCTALIPTGIAVAIPPGFEGQVRSRSGHAKNGLVVANSPGTIDPDYRGEVGVLLHNQGKFAKLIKLHERVAQLVIQTVPSCDFVVTDCLDETERGGGGFGHTG